jgi:hypothetical protein
MLHIACQHCGQQVEVDDLLAAASKKCPHCSHALMGDERPPAEPAAVQGMVKAYDWYIGATGHRVAFTRNEVEKLPMVCMCCGQAAARRVPHLFFLSYNSSNQYQQLADWMEAGTYQQGQRPWVQVPVPLCPAHENEFWWQRLHVVSLLIGIVAFAVLATFVTSRQVYDFGLTFLPAGLEIGLCAALLVMSVYSLLRLMWSLRVSGFYQSYVEMRCVSPKFIAALAEQRRQGPVPLP